MQKALTDFDCRKAKGDPERRSELHDGRVAGLSLRITPSGIKSWSFIYRSHGKRHRITLGRYPAMTLADARQRGLEAQGRVYKGEPPEKARRALSGADIGTVKNLVDLFLPAYRASGKKSWGEVKRDLSNHVLAPIGHRAPNDVRKRDLMPILLKFEAQPYTFNRLLSHLGSLFKWAALHDHIEANPTAGIERLPVQSRDRILTPKELGAIWKACDVVGWPWAPFIRLLMLTGQRRNEVAGMIRGHIDHNTGVWNIPGELTKNARAHLVPLSKTALDIITAVPVFLNSDGNGSPFVFPARGNLEAHISGFSDGKEQVDAHSKVTGWRLHDLRRTVATGLAEMQVAPVAIEAVLNHSSGARGGVAGTYNRYAYLVEKKAALDAWAARLDGIIAIL